MANTYTSMHLLQYKRVLKLFGDKKIDNGNVAAGRNWRWGACSNTKETQNVEIYEKFKILICHKRYANWRTHEIVILKKHEIASIVLQRQVIDGFLEVALYILSGFSYNYCSSR